MLTTIIIAIIIYVISGIAIYKKYIQLKTTNSILNGWHIDPKTQELLSRLGSDYENGIPYWEKLKEEDNERA